MSGWEVRFSNSRKLPYFYNQSSNESTWEPPLGMTEDQVRALPGAQYLQQSGGRPDGQVRASHILAKHTGSRRPSSWKQVSDSVLWHVVVRWSRAVGVERERAAKQWRHICRFLRIVLLLLSLRCSIICPHHYAHLMYIELTP